MTAPTPAPQGRMTPMMKQFFGVKREYPDALLFFRMGDFFELFFDDAKIAAKALGIALTSRSKEQDMPMAGVPVKSVDQYLHKLIRQGHTVVICDQVEDPRDAKGIVKREVTRIVTAGTVLEDALLEGDRHNWLAALLPSRDDGAPFGLAWIDLSTARFEAKTVSPERLLDELGRLAPTELLLPESHREDLPEALDALKGQPGRAGPAFSFRPDHDFEDAVARTRLCEHFGVQSLAGFGIATPSPVVPAAGAIVSYVKETQRSVAAHVKTLRLRNDEPTMLLDRAAVQALELLETSRERRREGTLLWCLDRTRTAAGGRLLRDWLLEPLTEVEAILTRQHAVAELHDQAGRRAALRTELEGVFDVARITARLALDRCSPRDLAQLRDSLGHLPAVRAALDDAVSPSLRSSSQQCTSPEGLDALLSRGLVDAPPMTLKDGGVIREGYSSELDELRSLRSQSKQTLAALQKREIERTGIPTLKVGFNSVFGYYIEITHVHKDRVPPEYVRKQTLKNAERFITPELKEYETKILTAEDRAARLEGELFETLRGDCARHVETLQEIAQSLAELDVLAALAEVSREDAYCRPELDDGEGLEIEAGFHPVLARTLGRDAFVPNDCSLGGSRPSLALITGPNMAGKSTYMRQTALIVLMAQIGCFVPARAARIGVVDRIFTRVGASDDLVQGASTFMVEMTETANLLRHATARSLVVLDEIGRGTGTYDGMSLAQALAEHLAEVIRCRTLFATHYHALTALADRIDRVKNLNVSVREWGEEIIFLHQIVAGGTDRSYGIQVARLAGLPGEVLVRAREILESVEGEAPISFAKAPAESPATREPVSKDVTDLAARIRTLDLDRIQPIEALKELYELRAIVAGSPMKRRGRRSRGAQGPSLFDSRTTDEKG